MDEIVDQMSNALLDCNETPKEREHQYKNWGKFSNQEARRKEILEIQKHNRQNKLDRFRGILELVNAVEETEIFKPQKQVFYRPNIYVAGFHRASPTYSNVLMMSEWMVEKPQDFHENWYVVPCPKGVRVLVVANQGLTKCYTKYGHFKFALRTSLPGGNNYGPITKNRCCVLDCFYVEKINTMYILDLLAWNNQPMTDGETEFRHYWLETQLAENPDLHKLTKKNQAIFKLLPKTPCTPEEFNKFMLTYPPPSFENLPPMLDGLLFYHKRSHYVAGQTPLVGWLFPYMVQEVLGSDILLNKAYESGKPANYNNYIEYIEKFEENAKKKNRHRRNSNNAMEVAVNDSKDEENRTGAGEAQEQNKMDSETVQNISTELLQRNQIEAGLDQQNKMEADIINNDSGEAQVKD